MKIFNNEKISITCNTEIPSSSELITNIGLTYPGTVMPLKPISANECNSLVGFNQLGLNEIIPCNGYGCCSNTLKITGNLRICQNLYVHGIGYFYSDVDIYGNLDVSGNVDISGNTSIGGNLDVSGNVDFDGNLDVSGNVDICGNLTVIGHTLVCDLSACNVDISQNLEVFGHTRFVDASGVEIELFNETGSTIIDGNGITNSQLADEMHKMDNIPGVPNYGLWVKANNLYIDLRQTGDSNGGFGMAIKLAENDKYANFRILNPDMEDNAVDYIFQVDGTGLTQARDIYPWQDCIWQLGMPTKRWDYLYACNIVATDISGTNLRISGNSWLNDISGTNLTVSGNAWIYTLLLNNISTTDLTVSGNSTLNIILGTPTFNVDTVFNQHLQFIDASGEQLQLKEDLTMYYGADFGNQLTLRSFPTSEPIGAGNYRVLDLSGGLAYFRNNFAVTNGVAGDNVGVVSIIHDNLTNASNQTVLQLSSAIQDAAFNVNQSIFKCKNTSLGFDLFNIDVGGHITAKTDRTGNSFEFKNEIAISGIGAFTDSVLFLSSAWGAVAPFDYDGTPLGGYSFIKCEKNAGGTEIICQIDGDGSIKAKHSITVSASTASWPPTVGSYNITLVPGSHSTITTRYSVFSGGLPRPGNPLQLQSAGNPELGVGFEYGNMVEIIPNYDTAGSSSYRTTGLKFNNGAVVTSTENILWWTNSSDANSAESLYMVTRPAGSTSGGFSSSRATFEMKAGGSFAGPISPYIFRYYPEGRDSGSNLVNRFILGDDMPGGIIQMGAGKVGATGGTVPTQGRLQANIVDCDAIDVIDIDSGSNTADLNIGTGLTQNIQMDMGNSGQIDMGTGSDIICSNGSVRICAANHNSIIGTWSLLPSSGTGLRGFSSTTTIGIIGGIAAKLCVLKNTTPEADTFLTLSAIEGPQATIFFRGQVQLDNFDAKINVDTCTATVGTLPIPHTIPYAVDISGRGLPVGTFATMFRYKEATVMVTNAGDPVGGGGPVSASYPWDMNFTRVAASLTFSGSIPSQTVLHIKSDTAGTPNIYVNYTIMVERNEVNWANGSNPFTLEEPVGSREYRWNPSRTAAAMNEITGGGWGPDGPV